MIRPYGAGVGFRNRRSRTQAVTPLIFRKRNMSNPIGFIHI